MECPLCESTFEETLSVWLSLDKDLDSGGAVQAHLCPDCGTIFANVPKKQVAG